jgi:signal transduction histidine kinase
VAVLSGIPCDTLTVFEDAPVFVALFSAPDMRVLFANKACRELMNRENVVGREISELMPELAGQGYLEWLEEAYRTGRPVTRHGSPLIIRANDSSEELKYVDFICQPIKDRTGKVVAILPAGYDVSDQHHATSEAARLTEELYESRRSMLVEGLAATLSHELKQPLSASSNYLGAVTALLERSNVEASEQISKLVTAAQEQIQRAGEIIQGLRSLSGARLPNRQSADFLRLAQEVINSTAASGLCEHARFRLHSDEHDIRLSCDPAQIFKVMSNLVRNACRAMGSEGGEVTIAARKSGNGMIEISVEDEGPGFTQELLESGSRIGHTTTDGLGIGLPLSEALVQTHGGHLQLSNHAGGARVTFEIPAAD